MISLNLKNGDDRRQLPIALNRHRANERNATHIDRVSMLHSPEAEEGVLGSMLIDPASTIPTVRGNLPAEAFYVPAHRVIFQHALDLFSSRGTCDLIILTQHLRDNRKLDEVGGAAFVTHLFTVVSCAAAIDYYAGIVRDKFLLRTLINKIPRILQEGYGVPDDVSALITNLQRCLDSVRSMADGQLVGVEDFQLADLLEFHPQTDPDNLVGSRWQCRGSTCVWAGGAGYGKSALAMQFAIYWANGLPLFGIKPVRPLKSLIVQAENDLGDMAEQFQGVLAGLRATRDLNFDECRSLIQKNLTIKRVFGSTADKFCGLLESLIQTERPDLVWIDPLFAFAGCDLKDSAGVSSFLREGIIPIAVRNQVCLHVVHHFGKPDRDSKAKRHWTNIDFQYLGFGSSEIQNAFRAVNVLLPVSGQESTFRLILSKRGSRGGALSPDGEATTNLYLTHARDGICWLQIKEPEHENLPRKGAQFEALFKVEDILSEMKSAAPMKTAALQKHVQTEIGMSRATFYRLFGELKQAGKIHQGENGWTMEAVEK